MANAYQSARFQSQVKSKQNTTNDDERCHPESMIDSLAICRRSFGIKATLCLGFALTLLPQIQGQTKPAAWTNKLVVVANRHPQDVWVEVSGFEVTKSKLIKVPKGKAIQIIVLAKANTCVATVRLGNSPRLPSRGAKPRFGQTIDVSQASGSPPIKVAVR